MELEGRHPLVEAKTEKMTTDHAISRATLGEIGNRVSAITIDSSKGGAIKKEILQPAGGVILRNPVALIKPSNIIKPLPIPVPVPVSSHAHPVQPVTKEIETERVKVEWMTDRHHLLQSAQQVKSDDVVLDFHPTTDLNVSQDQEDAFSRAFFDAHIEDIDAEDRNNPQLVSIYVNSIYDYMRSLEKKYSISQNFLEGSELTGRMRAILVDWLSQVHSRFHLMQETLYLTVAIIDRYLQAKPCIKRKLQLVGVTAMLVACKYEEMFVPEVADFVYITDNAYSKNDVKDMEQDILKTLDFSFGRPLCLHFLRRNSKAGQVDATKHTLAKYLMELSMVDYEMAHLRPSLVAAGALYLSMKLIDKSRWTETLRYHSSYSESDLIPSAQRLAQLVVKAENSKQTAVKLKYSSKKFMAIASLPQLTSKELLDMAQGKDF